MANAKTKEVIVNLEPTEEMKTKLSAINKANKENDNKSIGKLEAEITRKLLVAENARIRKEEYATWVQLEEPMVEAIKEFMIPQHKLKKVTQEINEVRVTKCYEYELKSVIVPIYEFVCEYKTKKLSPSSQWIYAIEKLNYHLTERAFEDLEQKENFHPADFNYQPSSAEFEFASEFSNKTLVKIIQQIVDMIVFTDNGKGKNMYKATNKDVNFMMMTLYGHGKAKTVSCPKNGTVVERITEVLNHIITGDEYEVVFDKRKKASK